MGVEVVWLETQRLLVVADRFLGLALLKRAWPGCSAVGVLAPQLQRALEAANRFVALLLAQSVLPRLFSASGVGLTRRLAEGGDGLLSWSRWLSKMPTLL